MSAASICSVKAVERTHFRLGSRIRAASVDAAVYTAAAEPPGMCRIHLSALLVTAGQHQTGFPDSAEELLESNVPLWSDEKAFVTFGSFQLNKAIPPDDRGPAFSERASEALATLAALRAT